ncbi:MCE family protein [Nocardia huaxiensis]|uniref:MCE family protein n=1 Tax=Nocardia huaxiensis TaxID=2755382 RepID=A0A7D6Z8G4_9NOCA|nr:MlaD family protein [Nocardia huaxiensis]QLY29568.1 MCE family protein [Nocardia huaxiensis]
MSNHSPARRWWRALAASTLGVAMVLPVGCGFNPAEVPVPGASVSGDTYELHIQFASALNLPTQAKVVANGAKIGNLKSVAVVDPSEAGPGRIDAVVEISSSVRLPRTTTVQLRQNTILGDIFIGLITPVGDTGATIPPGGVIPLTQTKPALQVEDLLVGMSTFITGGAVHQIQEIINQANAVLPQDKSETARIFDRMGSNIEDISANLDVMDGALAAFQKDLNAVLDNPDELGALLSERGAVDIPADVQALVNTLGIVGSLGTIGEALVWLRPFLDASEAAAKAFVPLMLGDNPLDLTAPHNLSKLVALLRDKVIPYVANGPKLNITGVNVAGPAAPVSNDEQVDAMVRALRMIGVVR